MEHAVGLGEGVADLRVRAGRLGGIGHAPMRAHGLAGPGGADLGGGVVADREDEIQVVRVGARELVPALGPGPVGAVVEVLEQVERERDARHRWAGSQRRRP